MNARKLRGRRIARLHQSRSRDDFGGTIVALLAIELDDGSRIELSTEDLPRQPGIGYDAAVVAHHVPAAAIAAARPQVRP